MEELDLTIIASEDGLLLQGPMFQMPSEWSGQSFGSDRILIDRKDSNSAGSLKIGHDAGFGRFTNFTFASLLRGMVQQEFDGMIAIEIGGSLKRLYFKQGELVFAGSNLIDDRLGEVIYRAGLITLEQLTDAAVQVNRSTKFGKVLIENGIFSTTQLWEALKLQVLSIFESVFVADVLFVRVEEGVHLAPTAVSMGESTLDLIDEAQGYTAMLRGFIRQVEGNPKIGINEVVLTRLAPSDGTFIKDMIDLVSQNSTADALLQHSKLSKTNTCASLFELVHRHLVQVERVDAVAKKYDRSGAYREIKSLLDAYHLVLEGARKAFQSEGVTLPVQDLEVFLEREYSLSRSPLFVLPDGVIAPEAVHGMLIKSRVSRRQGQRGARHLQGLILFLLQLVGDLLPGGRGWELKRNFQNMIT